MKYSIIIPAYHSQDTIIDCLKSIGTNLDDTEIIIVSDEREQQKYAETRSIIEAYVQEQQLTTHICIVKNEKKHGVSGARNTGLEYAKGDYIWFVDSDDRVYKNWRDEWDRACEVNADLFVAGYETWTDLDKTEIKPCTAEMHALTKTEFVKHYLLPLKNDWFINAVWNKLFRRDFLVCNQVEFPENGSMGEDLCFCLMAIKSAKGICLVNSIIYQYMNYTDRNSLCSIFHMDALDMTCLAWKLEKTIYENEYIELPSSEIEKYQADVETYQQNLIINNKGTLKQYYDSERYACEAGIKNKRTLRELWKAYYRLKIQRIKIIMRAWMVKR